MQSHRNEKLDTVYERSFVVVPLTLYVRLCLKWKWCTYENLSRLKCSCTYSHKTHHHYTVNCTLNYTLHYTVQCTLYIIVHNVHCTMYIILYIECTLYNVQYALYNEHWITWGILHNSSISLSNNCEMIAIVPVLSFHILSLYFA